MKSTSLLAAFFLVGTLTLTACSSQTNVVANAEAEQSESMALENSQKYKLLPEEHESILIGYRELNSAIEAYGIERYRAIFPQYNELYNKFIADPSIETKTELMTFLRESEMFAQIVKPVPDSLFNSARAKGVIIAGYDGAECDYAKIEAYLDEKISGPNAHGVQVSFTHSKS